MAQVEITVNNRQFRVACEDGQEGHLRDLAAYFDSKVASLAGTVGQLGDTSLMVMAGLLVADELSDLRNELAAANSSAEARAAQSQALAREEADATYVKRINALAEQIEDVAGRLNPN